MTLRSPSTVDHASAPQGDTSNRVARRGFLGPFWAPAHSSEGATGLAWALDFEGRDVANEGSSRDPEFASGARSVAVEARERRDEPLTREVAGFEGGEPIGDERHGEAQFTTATRRTRRARQRSRWVQLAFAFGELAAAAAELDGPDYPEDGGRS
jgi:hypothetical protein